MKRPIVSASIDDVLPNELTRRICFDVFTDESNPHETGPMTVTIDPRGLSCHWTGAPKDPWEFTWWDLRGFCERLRKEDYQSQFDTQLIDDNEKLEATIETLRGFVEKTEQRERERLDGQDHAAEAKRLLKVTASR